MEKNEKESMVRDIVLQVALMLLMIFMFLAMHGIPKKFLDMVKLRLRNRAHIQAKRHFVQGAQLLARARSSNSKARSSLATEALAEAEKAITLDPKDAAAYLLKSLALDLQGFRTSALDSLDMALSPLTAKSLTDGERGDALLRRAELKKAMNQVDSALTDLTQSVKLSPKNVKGFCLLGECYEEKKMEEEARKAYNEALQMEPELSVAQEALNRLGS